MVAEDLHAGLCVGVVGWLEAQFGDAWKGKKYNVVLHLKGK